MTLQPFSIAGNKYQEIPDVEDVTPVDGQAYQQKNRSKNVIIIIIITTLIAIAATIYAEYFPSASKSRVNIIQTSENSFGDRFFMLDPLSLLQRGFYFDKLDFGNSGCMRHESDFSVDCDKEYKLSRIVVDSGKTFQETIGFGGAFTEASAFNFYNLPIHVQDKVMELYFGEDGIGLTLGRIHINSCDFSLESYSFDDVEDDFDLQYFDSNVTHDTKAIIPFIKAAMAKSSSKINLLASPWSPPAWMKQSDNGIPSMLGSEQPQGLSENPKIQAAWALYFSKFIEAYEKHGVPIWAVTPQNEPEFAAPWEACSYNASFESDFINNHLGPTIKSKNPNVLILAFDHNKDDLPYWTETILSKDENNYVDGMAFHWYIGEQDRYLDGSFGYDAVNYSYHYAPSKILIGSEACSCPDVSLDNWLRAERLAHDVMFDMLNFAQGWIDWNLIVDYQGGPNHLDNFCDASIVTLKDYSDVYIQPKYYYFGHISKYVKPGYIRIDSAVIGNYEFADVPVNVRFGTEVQIFDCEKSTRQQWTLSSNGTIGLLKLATDGFSQWSKLVNLCLAGHGKRRREYLQLQECPEYTIKDDVLTLNFNSNDQIVELTTGLCVEVANGLSVPGGLLKLSTCLDSASSKYIDQLFTFNVVTGEIVTKAGAGLCLTAGWPFLTGFAFQNPVKTETVIVVMNEANTSTNIILNDKKENKNLRFGINERAIQTIIY